VAGVFGGEGGADDGVEFVAGDELADGEFADGEDEVGLEDFHFGGKPAGAIFDFVGGGDTIAAGGIFAGETAADGGHVDAGAEGGFVDAGVVLKPAKEFFAGGPGERAAEDRFLVAGGLADEEDAADDGAAGDDGLLHARAEVAAQEGGDVELEGGHGEAET
jgi:hypothetical protein